MMNPAIPGIHHVTAIAADAQKNIDFYCGVLGLRLVKVTVNFDDPESYHLYYGDELGRPGTIITFFAWPGGYPGRIGPPQVTTTALAVPQGALDYWSSRLAEHGVNVDPPAERFGEWFLQLVDPDGLKLEIVADASPGGEPWTAGPTPTEHAIRGFHSVTIAEEGYETTARLLSELMGFQAAGNEQNRFRYRAGSGDGFAATVDLLCAPDSRHGSMGTGVVHHVAFRTSDRSQQDAWRKRIVEAGMNVSPVMDRNYFHSIYYREPGGVLLEIATDGPGFAADEPADQLGSKLMLPEQYEAYRAKLKQHLPQIRLPAGGILGGVG
jgi:glyoxalase family protein